MNRATVLSAASLALAAAVAGCGSSATNTKSSARSPAAGSTSSSGGGYAPYGASSTAQASTTSGASVITTKSSKLGTILAVGGKDLTVYLFEADKGGKSACSGSCASVWPPVTGPAKASGQALGADLGTIKRADGTVQVTYKGHPLYRYLQDNAAGDVLGEGIKSFGAAWYAVKPSGQPAR